MRRYGNRRTKRYRRVGVLLLTVVLLLGVGTVYLDNQLRPIVQSYGVQAARRGAMLAIHNGMEAVLSELEPQYRDMVSLTRDENGRILSAETNVLTINAVKARASAVITELLAECTTQRIEIPLGSLIGGTFFTGRGPFLPLRIHSNGSVLTTISDDFSSAGINQTCHRIYLNTIITVTVMLPLERQSFSLETSFLLCENVLVGEIPDSFTGLEFNEKITEKIGLND